MSRYRQLLSNSWPWHTLRAAYREWQAQESRLVEARQRLALEYQAACRQAEQVQIDPDQGLLRTARSWLDQTNDPQVLQVRDHLARMFALQGKGFCRRVPSILEVELAHYVARVEKLCRSHADLAGRLRLAQAMITVFYRTPEFCGPNFFQLALSSPESAWLLFHLRQKRRRDRQTLQDLLSNAKLPSEV